LSSILHKIGVCLHYQKNELLGQLVILKNEWATDAVYRILEDPVVAEEKKGFFDRDDLKRIWSDETYADMRPQLLELMQQFKMAYPLPNGREFVTPPLLPPAPPEGWVLPESDTRTDMLVEYKFLPKVLLTQFIVSRHADIDRERTLVWRNGVVLRWSADTVAEVKSLKSRGRDAFSIVVQGGERRGLLTAILKTLRDLHGEYKGIEAYEIVPCPCSVCRAKKTEQEKHFFEFANLQNRLEKGRKTVECDKSLKEIDLVKLLGDLLVFEHLGVGRPVVLKDVRRSVAEEIARRWLFFPIQKRTLTI
jgi:internalin A